MRHFCHLLFKVFLHRRTTFAQKGSFCANVWETLNMKVEVLIFVLAKTFEIELYYPLEMLILSFMPVSLEPLEHYCLQCRKVAFVATKILDKTRNYVRITKVTHTLTTNRKSSIADEFRPESRGKSINRHRIVPSNCAVTCVFHSHRFQAKNPTFVPTASS